MFQGEKDFKDIQLYVWKEYDVFRVFYESVHTRIKDKVKYFDEETQAILSSQNAALSEKVFQKHLREYTTGRPITDSAERAKAVATICGGFFATVLPELVRQGIVTLGAASAGP